MVKDSSLSVALKITMYTYNLASCMKQLLAKLARPYRTVTFGGFSVNNYFSNAPEKFNHNY